MDSRFCRYTKTMLQSMGIDHPYTDDQHYVKFDSDLERRNLDELVKGQFKQIIDILFDSDDGSLDNNIRSLVSENAPESVRSFIQNVLMCDVQALKSAPDDETAFNTLIPRSAQTSVEMRPYLEFMAQTVSDARAAYQQQQSSSSASTTQSTE